MAFGGSEPVILSATSYTLAVGVLNGVLALRYRTGRRSLTELRLADALTTAVTYWMVAGILTQLRPATEVSVSLQLGVTYVLIARTVLLPSSGRRTLLVCLLALIPVGAVVTWLRVSDLGREATPNEWLLQGYVGYRSLAITAFLATLSSNVIYGLRRRVHEIARVGQYVLRALRDALLGCESAGRWNATSAAGWWSAHRDRFRAHCEAQRRSRATAADLGGAETEPLRIDLERRLRGEARSD